MLVIKIFILTENKGSFFIENINLELLPVSIFWAAEFGSLYVSGKLATYPSPKPLFYPKWEASVNVGLGEGKVGSFPETYNLYLYKGHTSKSPVGVN